MTNKSNLELIKKIEDEAIKAIEHLLNLAKEGDKPARIIINGFFEITARMSHFLKNPPDLDNFLTSIQNAMYQTANEINNSLEGKK